MLIGAGSDFFAAELRFAAAADGERERDAAFLGLAADFRLGGDGEGDLDFLRAGGDLRGVLRVLVAPIAGQARGSWTAVGGAEISFLEFPISER